MRAAVIGMMLLYEPAVRCDYLRFRAWPSEFKTIEACQNGGILRAQALLRVAIWNKDPELVEMAYLTFHRYMTGIREDGSNIADSTRGCAAADYNIWASQFMSDFLFHWDRYLCRRRHTSSRYMAVFLWDRYLCRHRNTGCRYMVGMILVVIFPFSVFHSVAWILELTNILLHISQSARLSGFICTAACTTCIDNCTGTRAGGST